MFTEDLLASMFPGLSKGHLRMMAVPWFVGQFVMTWAKHERMLAEMLARIRGEDYETLRDRLLDDQINAYEKEVRRTLEALGPDHPSSVWLTKVLDDHVILRDLRHDVVHGFWNGIGPNEEYQLKRKRRKNPDAARTLSLKELVEGTARLDALGVAVLNASRAYEGKILLSTERLSYPSFPPDGQHHDCSCNS